MKKELRDKLDKELRKVRKYVYIGIVFILIASLTLFFPFTPLTSRTLEGTTIKYSAHVTDLGNRPFVMVKLDNNETIKAKLPTKLKYRDGGRVEVVEKKTIIGARTYVVARYIK